MEFYRATLDDCDRARGVAVVIDVLRAFTTAAYAFAAGAESICLAGTVEEALSLRQRLPGSLAMGEVGGLPVEGFDFSNSPAEISRQDLGGVRLVQRTTAGVQGVLRSRQADARLGASFAVAAATARRVHDLAPTMVTFVLTGVFPDGAGDEDAACADYLEALLRGQDPDPAPYLERVRRSVPGRRFADPDSPEFPAEDLDFCTRLDRFDFALPVREEGDLLVMRGG